MKTVKKALDVLDSFDKEAQEQSFSDILNKLGFHKSTTHILLKTLTEQNYLIYDPKAKKYSLGYKLLELAGRITYGRDIRNIAMPVMQDLSETLKEDVALNILVEGRRVCIAIAESQSFVRHIVPLGKALPLHCSAAGKVLMAHLGQEEIAGIVEKYGLQKFTPKTITSKKLLSAELKQVKKNGYGESRTEFGEEAAAIAFPVINGKGEIVAALSIQTTVNRLNEKTRDLFILEGRKASQKIGGYLLEVLS